MEGLSPDIKYRILLNSDLDTLDSMCRADKSSNDICSSRKFWTHKIEHDFGLITSDIPRYDSIDPYFLYQFLSITNGVCGGTLLSFISEDCLYKVGASGRAGMISYYFTLLGDRYNEKYLALINGALDKDNLEIVYDIIDTIGAGPKGDPILETLKLATDGHIETVIALIERYPDLEIEQMEEVINAAIDNDRLDIVQYLTGSGIYSLPPELYEELYPSGIHEISDGLLSRAINLSKYEIVKYLVDKYYNKEIPMKVKRNLLNLAARQPDHRIEAYIKMRVPTVAWHKRLFR